MRTSGDPRRILRLAMLGAVLAGAAHAQTIMEYPIASPSNYPGSIATGPDGNLWFTEGPAGAIGRITTDGVVTEFPLPTPDYVPAGIVVGPDGNLWFTEQVLYTHARQDRTDHHWRRHRRVPHRREGLSRGHRGRTGRQHLVRRPPRDDRENHAGRRHDHRLPDRARSTPATASRRVPTATSGSRAPLANTIGRITPAGVVTTFPVPTAHAVPDQIAAGADGNLWFTEDSGGIGRITTAGVVTEFQPPTANNFTYGIAAGPDGNVWFTESRQSGSAGPGQAEIGRITPSGESRRSSSSRPGAIRPASPPARTAISG